MGLSIAGKMPALLSQEAPAHGRVPPFWESVACGKQTVVMRTAQVLAGFAEVSY